MASTTKACLLSRKPRTRRGFLVLLPGETPALGCHYGLQAFGTTSGWVAVMPLVQTHWPVAGV